MDRGRGERRLSTKENSMGVVTHGDSTSVGNLRLYRIYNKMHARCYDPKQHGYEHYGGRGIQICREWNGNYVNFRKWALNNGYNKNLSIDRIDNDKDYEPPNCRWVDQHEQHRNQRSNIKYKNEIAKDASFRLGGSKNLVNSRLRLGWGIEDAFNMPNKGRVTKETQREILRLLEDGNSQKDIAKMFNLNQATISRIKNKLCP